MSYLVLFPVLGYLCGSLPFSIWITRLVKGVDVRDSGSGHATTTNTIRQAGFGWGALVFILDVSKGFAPTYIATNLNGSSYYLVALTAACAVAGHCWPVFARFRGGMGLATMGGSLLAVSPPATLVCLAILISLVLLIRHSARASVLTGLCAAPVLWLFHFRDAVFWMAVFGGLVIVVRFLIDWNRQYRELWLDRDQAERS